MANLKELKNRITSVKSTQKITRAMKMVAASKLRRSEETLRSGQPFAEAINLIMADLMANIDDSSKPQIMKEVNDDNKTYLLLVCTGDRGLCGGFNGNIVKKAKAKARLLTSQGKDFKFACIGQKAYQLLKTDYKNQIIAHKDLSQMPDIYKSVKEFSDDLLQKYENNQFNCAILYYAKYQSVMTQIVTEKNLIPISNLPTKTSCEKLSQEENITQQKTMAQQKQNTSVIEFEPNAELLLAKLCPLYIVLGIFNAVQENGASEQGARMTAMENATQNAGEMIDRLTLTFNRARQAQITKELIEVISGAEAI